METFGAYYCFVKHGWPINRFLSLSEREKIATLAFIDVYEEEQEKAFRRSKAGKR